MGDDQAMPVRLWLEKRGEIEPADLSDNLIVQLGTVTEDLNRRRISAIPAVGPASRCGGRLPGQARHHKWRYLRRAGPRSTLEPKSFSSEGGTLHINGSVGDSRLAPTAEMVSTRPKRFGEGARPISHSSRPNHA